MELILFVYGTLQHGAPAHARYCAGARGWARAWTRGRLYEHRDGYPVMVPPLGAVHALGTADGLADARAAAFPPTSTHATRLARSFAALLPSAACTSRVHGEILELEARRSSFDALDEYEGFEPGRPSTFVRVLMDVTVPARGASLRAWTYVAGSLTARSELAPVPSGIWRA